MRVADLGTAYVQIVPSAKGISGAITKELNGEAGAAGTSAGQSVGKNLVGKLKGVIAAAGIGKLIGKTLTEGANLQQSIGGIETLFGDAAGTVQANASKAFETVGMSANAYMENVTGFSATLLQGLGGDTAKAASIADMAMTDMADNANKMGTDMSAITNAYQGFAKDNYTMLDNLKLGYGGTASEMARLINDSGVLGDSVKVTAETVKDVPFDQIIAAIHKQQDELGITGTTAKEAASTFTGSMNAMKAAASNLLGDLALGNDIGPALDNLMETVNTFLTGNLIPMLGNVFNGLAAALPSLMSSLMSVITANLPIIIETMVTVTQTIISALTQGDSLSQLISGAIQIITALATGLIQALPQLVAAIPPLITALVTAISNNIGPLVNGAIQIMMAIAQGLIQSIPILLQSIPQIISSLISGFASAASQLGSIGKNIVQGIWNGISSAGSWLWNQIQNWANGILSKIKGAFQIGSPSKLMRDEVGIYLAQGIGVGFANGMRDVNEQIKSVALSDYGLSTTVGVNYAASGSLINNAQAAAASGPAMTGGIALYIDGIKYNSDEYIDTSIGNFVEAMVRKSKMYA